MVLDDGGVGFLDFGVCGRLGAPLRGALLLQGASFLTGDTLQFCEGFAHALNKMGHTQTIDTRALAKDMEPLFEEFATINPFAKPEVSPQLPLILARGQVMLCRHGVQLPNEFALLLKTIAFGAQYFQILDCDVLARQLTMMAGAFVLTSHEVGVDATAVLSPEVRTKLAEILRAEIRSAARSRAARIYSSAAAVPLWGAVMATGSLMATAFAATTARYMS
jgi:predicted unusual protein kinase regulating ubiquinone biosynthesis (AarF/ABC1/UbiB family)